MKTDHPHQTTRPVYFRQLLAVQLLRGAAQSWACVEAYANSVNTESASDLRACGQYVEGVTLATRQALHVSMTLNLSYAASEEYGRHVRRCFDALDQSETQEAIEALGDLADFLAPYPNHDERASVVNQIDNELDIRGLFYDTMLPEDIVAMATGGLRFKVQD